MPGDDAASIKDVYTAVTESRTEVLGQITDLREHIDTVVTNHEHRLTVAETHLASTKEQLTNVDSRLIAHGHDIGRLKDQQIADEAVTKVLTDAKSRKTDWRHWLIGTVLATALVVVSILATAHV